MTIWQKRDRRRRQQVARREGQRRLRKAQRAQVLPPRVEQRAGEVEQGWKNAQRLQAQGGDASATRLVRRCRVTGRGRGVLRHFRRSRRVVRQRARAGQLPGVRTGQW